MTVETGKFVITRVDFAYTQSREITTSPKQPVKTGINEATLFCKNCEHLWRARPHGEGSFYSAAGFFTFECPKCHESEAIVTSAVMGAI